MKPLFAMEGIDYVEPASEPIEGPEPDINIDTARVEENVLALDSAYYGIENALESLEALEKVKEAVSSSGEELSPAALKIVQITVENIKAQTGLFTNKEIVSLEAVNDTGFSLEGLGNVMQAIWDAIARTFSWIWNTIRGILGFNKTVKETKAMEMAINNVDTDGTTKEHTLTSGRYYEDFVHLGDELTLDVLRKFHKEIQSSEEGVLKMFEAAAKCEASISEILLKMDRSERGNSENFDQQVGAMTQSATEFIRAALGTLQNDTSISLSQYNLAFSEERYRRGTQRFAGGLTRGRLIMCSAVEALAEDHDDQFPHLEIIAPKMNQKDVSVKVEEISNKEALAFMEEISKAAKDSRSHTESVTKKSDSNAKIRIRSLEDVIKGGAFDGAALKTLRVFNFLLVQLGKIQIASVGALDQLSGSRMSLFRFVTPTKK